MKASPLLFLFGFLITQPSAYAAKEMCPTSRLLAEWMGVTPNQIKWDKDLRAQCNIQNQWYLGICWDESGLQRLDQVLHQSGDLAPTELLSNDYYAAMRIEGQIVHDFKLKRPKISEEFDEGYSVTLFHDFFLRAGVVRQDQYRFPTFNGKSIRTSEKLHKMFYEQLNIARKNQDTKHLQKTLVKYLGDLSKAPAKAPSAHFIKAIKESTYAGKQILDLGLDKIESQIIGALDSGAPVSFGIQNFGNRVDVAYKTSHIYSGVPNPLKDNTGGHAMNIIGYHLGKNGKVDWYLIENSWGKRFGTEGTATISAKYLYQQTMEYAIPAVKR